MTPEEQRAASIDAVLAIATTQPNVLPPGDALGDWVVTQAEIIHDYVYGQPDEPVREIWIDRDPVLQKLADGEPFFVIRAQDVTAPDAIRFWLNNAQEQGADLPPQKKKAVLAIIKQMEEWPTTKLPD